MLSERGETENQQQQVLPTAVEQEYWTLGLGAFDATDYEVAPMHFRKLGGRSRPLYNVSVCYLLMQDEESAVIIRMIVTLERCLRCDPYFCLGHFQLGYLFHALGKFQMAINHYNDAIQSMRGNGTIDYKQLGLEAIVYACELFYNMAAAQMELCDRGAALRSLVNSHQYRCLVRHDIVDHAMISSSESRWILFQPPMQKVFRTKNQRRTLSLGSLRAFQNHIPSSRSLVRLAEGETDDSTTFMAPIEADSVQKEISKVQDIHTRKHSRSTTGLGNYYSDDSSASTSPSSPLNLAKFHFIDKDGKTIQSRIVSLDDCPNFETLLEKVKSKFQLLSVKLKFLDQDGDLITMCDDCDLNAAYEVSKSSNVRLVLWCCPIKQDGGEMR